MGAADSCLYIERECKTEDNYPILGSQTPVVCLCNRSGVRPYNFHRRFPYFFASAQVLSSYGEMFPVIVDPAEGLRKTARLEFVALDQTLDSLEDISKYISHRYTREA